MDYNLNLDKKADKGVILNSRILWFYSMAYKTIGGEELVYAARAISTRTYEQMFPLVGTAVIYLILVLIFTWLQGLLERRLRQSDRR